MLLLIDMWLELLRGSCKIGHMGSTNVMLNRRRSSINLMRLQMLHMSCCMIRDLKLSGTLSAKSACLLSHWAKQGGMTGLGATLAAFPGWEGGNYSAHFDKVTGLSEEMSSSAFYTLQMPTSQRWSASRAIVPMCANLVHQRLFDGGF